MDVGSLLKNLSLDTWYKVVMTLGGAVLAASFFLEVKGVTNQQLQLLSGGAFLIGLGEWKNHKVMQWFKPPNIYTGGPALMSQKVRSPDLIGWFLDLAGFVLLLAGIWKIIRG